MKKRFFYLAACALLTLGACGNKNSESNETEVEGEEIVIEDNNVDTPAANDLEDMDNDITNDEDATIDNEGENTTEPAETTASAGESSNIDKFLTQYSELVDEYDKMMTKMSSGKVDMSSLMSVADKAQKIQTEVGSLKGQMTTAQLKQYENLVKKMASIAAKASKVDPSKISMEGIDLNSLGL